MTWLPQDNDMNTANIHVDTETNDMDTATIHMDTANIHVDTCIKNDSWRAKRAENRVFDSKRGKNAGKHRPPAGNGLKAAVGGGRIQRLGAKPPSRKEDRGSASGGECPESCKDSIIQPKVAPSALPWVKPPRF